MWAEFSGRKFKGQSPARKIPMEMISKIDKRNIFFIGFTVLTIILFLGPLRMIFSRSFHDELYSHMILIPAVSAYFLYQKRKKISLEMEWAVKPGILLTAASILIYAGGLRQELSLSQHDLLAWKMGAVVLFWMGGFLSLYGFRAFRTALFPLLFLFFMVPIPEGILETVIAVLQAGSAEATNAFFKMTGIPVLREGFTFHLSGITVEVAKQCSGIRSTISLLITSIIAGHLFLHTGWKKLVLIMTIFPITIIKNGLRIVTLTLLGNYVDVRILGSELHKSGGIPFFIVALTLLAPVLLVLRKSEKNRA